MEDLINDIKKNNNLNLNCICIYSVNIVNYFMFIGRYYICMGM